MTTLALGMTGCGSSLAGLCDDYCDCEGCSDNELDDCIDDAEDAEKRAEEEGCGDQLDEYVSCIDSEFECRDGDVDADGCEREAQNLGECLN